MSKNIRLTSEELSDLVLALADYIVVLEEREEDCVFSVLCDYITRIEKLKIKLNNKITK